ncbi:hypothetical protein LCGC14_1135070 [marine sediment metagenome]|uniref:Uncharacterized protein n=1 Tax=marine sediment metagenome TaxID=412755 RepID=A0A0F9MMU5_9ZZZZ
MKDFTYHEKEYSLEADACSWLTIMGLRETLWILDLKWIIHYYNGIITYSKWIKEK